MGTGLELSRNRVGGKRAPTSCDQTQTQLALKISPFFKKLFLILFWNQPDRNWRLHLVWILSNLSKPGWRNWHNLCPASYGYILYLILAANIFHTTFLVVKFHNTRQNKQCTFCIYRLDSSFDQLKWSEWSLPYWSVWLGCLRWSRWSRWSGTGGRGGELCKSPVWSGLVHIKM